MRRLRIALCTHSTNPRGGVAHALALGEALRALGHEPVAHAPDPAGTGFYRSADCATRSVAATPLAPAARADVASMARARVADYVRHFEQEAHRRFDVFHAQDSLSGLALAQLSERGVIPGFARTVHHIDDFADPALAAMQERAITAARALFVVSRAWRGELLARHGRSSTVIGNGVDPVRFSPEGKGNEPALRARLGLGGGPALLAVGGVEGRKNTLRLLQAFALLHARRPGAQLLIAGGASLLDHSQYQAQFRQALAAADLPPQAVIVTGPLPDADFPALYRIAAALALPSVKEGFGLAVVEAMASGLPVVASRIAPFTEYLGPGDAAWCDPLDPASIAAAMDRALDPETRVHLASRGHAVAARHTWRAVGEAHLPVYAALSEAAYA